MRGIIIKEGPLVFLKDVLLMEFIAFVLLFGASFLANYEMLYKGWNLDHFMRYDIFIILVSSLFQFVYLIVLFINWYFSYFEINDKEITRKSGILFHHKKSVTLSDIVSVETYQSPIDRLINHATIILEHRGDRITKIKNVSNFNEYIHIIKHAVSNAGQKSFPVDIENLIKIGEGISLEFKSTLRYDLRKGEVSKEMERIIIKSIVGFLNAEGGTLLIGVNDEGIITGLKNDYRNLPKKNRDGFENHLTMLIKTMIGLQFTKYVDIKFEYLDGEDVCVVNVKKGHKPAYLRNLDKKEEFFVRVGNSTQPFSMSETEEYIKSHF